MRKISLTVVTGALGIVLVLAGAAVARSTASSIQLRAALTRLRRSRHQPET